MSTARKQPPSQMLWDKLNYISYSFNQVHFIVIFKKKKKPDNIQVYWATPPLTKTSGGAWAPEPCWLWVGLRRMECSALSLSNRLCSRLITNTWDLRDLSSERSVLLRAKWLSRYLGQREEIQHVFAHSIYKPVQTIPKVHNNYTLSDMCVRSMKKQRAGFPSILRTIA